MSDHTYTSGVVDDDLIKLNEIKLMNEVLKQKYKEIKKELKEIVSSFENDKQRINRQMLEVVYNSKQQKNEENDKLKKHTEVLETSLKNIANNYVLIEKKVWNEQFNGNISNMNTLLEKVCDLEHNIRILESEIIEKEEFYKNELLLIK
tara:strand:+ start:1615 stop:2061 length:447 start_codon:yes stop_codon:yes gene_type:complete